MTAAERLTGYGYEQVRMLPTGEAAGLSRFLFTTGLCVGLTEIGYRTRFCYPDRASAEAALAEWDGNGDPPGPWIKEKGERERSNPARFKGIPVEVEHDAG